MPHDLRSGYLGRWLAAQGIRGEVAMGATLTTLALAVEAKTKENASQGAHARGTHTPSSPGSGPSVITGDYRRAITHDPVALVGGVLQTRVGPANTPHSGSRTSSGKIGLYLETGLRNGSTYPHLGPAFDEVIVGRVAEVARVAWDSHGVGI